MRVALRLSIGSAAGGMAALALLVCGCVFAALAGPALSLHTRTEALQQTLAGYPVTTKTVQVSTTWGGFSEAVNGGAENQPLGDGTLARTRNELGTSLTAVPLPLAPGAWASMASAALTVPHAAPSAQAGAPPKLEVVFRDPVTSYLRLVQGSLTSQGVPAGTLAVVATQPMAARFGLRPGSRLTLSALTGGPVTVMVTGIVQPRQAGSTFWQQDTALVRPSLEEATILSPYYWAGGLIADPDQFGAMQRILVNAGLGLQWEFPLGLGAVSADQLQGLDRALNRAATVAPQLSGPLAPGAEALTVSSPLTRDLGLFLTTQSSVQTVLLLLFVSLVVTGAAVILLAARMIVTRREAELRLLRSRGGSLRRIAALMSGGALAAAAPGAVVGAALAVALVPGGTLAGGWPLAAAAVAAALVGPPVIACWLHRRPTAARTAAGITTAETRAPARSRRRLVAEVTAVAAALAGLIVLHDQGPTSSTGTDLFLAATPVLVALPVVVIMLRLYPLAIRGLLTLSRRGPGATGFLALSRAARSSLTGVLPAFALVLTLSLAAFAGMVSQGITRGEVAASWQATGADAVIQPGNQGPITAAAVRAAGAVAGVRHATTVWNTTWSTPDGVPVTVTAVDPASYAALAADTPFPAVPASRIGRAAPAGALAAGATLPVLASPAAASVLGRGPATLGAGAGGGSLTVRVTGVVTATPAQPSGGAFVIIPLQRLPGPDGTPTPNALLVTGTAIDHAQLTAAASRVVPGGSVAFRSAVLAELAAAPLQHGAGLIITLTIATAAALGLFIVVLGLALGAAERRFTLARLAVLGYQRPAGLVVTEVMPGVLAAVVAGLVCALVLPSTVGPGIDLAAFTGTGAAVRLQPDALSLALPAVIIAGLTLAALAAEAWTLRRRDICGQLRME